MWIQKSSFALKEEYSNKKCALWSSDNNWVLGLITVDDSGTVIGQEAKYTVPANGDWAWNIIDQFGDGSLAIKKTSANSISIPQGLEITESNYSSTLIAKYQNRYISGNVFPVEGDTFYQYDGNEGNHFICYKNSSGVLTWGLRTANSSYDTLSAEASWLWPDKAKFGTSYGGTTTLGINTVSTGTSNIRIEPISGQETLLTEFGVYKRLTSFSNGSYQINFSYDSPEIKKEFIDEKGVGLSLLRFSSAEKALNEAYGI